MKILRIFLGILIAAIGLVLFLYFLATQRPDASAQHVEVDFTISCVECHSSTSPEVVQDWKEGKHGEYDHGCQICHGVSAEDFNARPGNAQCRRCHGRQKIFPSQTCARSCFDCHDGHSLKFHG
jgi:hypothetical protein